MDRWVSWTYKQEHYSMPDQRLPRVQADLFQSISADMKPESFEQWVTKLATENPQIVILLDALEKPSPITAVAMVYHVLDKQAEADQMNSGDFS